jgi:PAS domain S-box-containing protein
MVQAPLRTGVTAASLGVATLGALMLIQRGFPPALGIAVAAGMFYAACVLLLRFALQRARQSAARLKAQSASQEVECARLEREVAERSDAEAALRRIDTDLARAQRQAHVGSWRWSDDSQEMIECSDEFVRIYGIDRERIREIMEDEIELVVHPEDRERVRRAYERQYATGEPGVLESRIVRPDGEVRHVSEITELVRGVSGDADEWFGAVQDITEIKQAEARLEREKAQLGEQVEAQTANLRAANLALESEIAERNRAEAAWREREVLLESTAAISNVGYALWDEVSKTYRYTSDQFTELDGTSEKNYVGVHGTYKWDLEIIDPEDRERHQKWYEDYLADPKETELEYRINHAELGARHLREFMAPIFDDRGRLVQSVVAGQDITELIGAREQLRQAHRMEAVGQLTGGIAHDFNNLLAVILGNLELVSGEVGEAGEVLECTQRAIAAAERSAKLTHRLLAFSRKQALRPEPVDANALVRRMLGLLWRTLGGAVEVEVGGDADLWLSLVDPGQLENSLLNLAINARDAMPKGGKLTIEASNARIDSAYAEAQDDAEPGQYVLVAVSDTGEGMAEAVMDHAFEPFFTTKDVGKGSGLGLSMVYGFVKQSGGHVRIHSEVAQGTTINLYLPRYFGDEKEVMLREPTEALPQAENEVVLVVEDDADLRTLIVRMLKVLGYGVYEASSGAVALAVLPTLSQVDLLLTDMVLPGGMGGRELVEVVRRERPGLPALYMSGYAENAIFHHGHLDEGIQLLQKPFRMGDIARAVREAIGNAGC